MAFRFFDWLGNTTLSAKSKRKPSDAPIRGAVEPAIRTPVDPLLDEIDQVEQRMQSADVRLDAPAGLIRAAMRDAWAYALLQVRTSGLCTLPVIYDGPKSIVKKLQAVDEAGLDGFSKHFSPVEQALMLVDVITLGVAVGQIVLDKDAGRKIVVRRTPDHLSTRGRQLHYNNFPISPGDGTWVVLNIGLERPWLQGAWIPLCRATSKRMLGEFNRLAFVAALANAITLLNAPVGANEYDMQEALDAFSSLGTNNTKVLPAGWKADLLEIKSSVGTAAFDKTTGDAKEDIAMIICGQTVTTQGSAGSGFINVKYFDAIRRDLQIKDAGILDQAISEQVMPHLFPGASRRIDLTNDNDKIVVAQRYTQGAAAIQALRNVFSDESIDLQLLTKQLGLPVNSSATLKQAATPDQTQQQQTEPNNEN